MKTAKFCLKISSLLLLAVATACVKATTLPPVIKYLRTQGLTIHSTFTAPDGMTGYVGSVPKHGRFIFYVPREGTVALFGDLITDHGRDLTTLYSRKFGLTSARRQRKLEPLYKMLQSQHWIAIGVRHAKHVIYAFIDPNCPYCHKLWEEAANAVKHHQSLQIRYVVVGILSSSSLHKAAAILSSSHPSRALAFNESHYQVEDGGIRPIAKIAKTTSEELAHNFKLMAQFGFDGTPGIVWKGTNGKIHTSNGLPPRKNLTAIFSSARK